MLRNTFSCYLRTLKIKVSPFTSNYGLWFLLGILIKDMKKLWMRLNSIFVSPVSCQETKFFGIKGVLWRETVCVLQYAVSAKCIWKPFFCSFYCCCYIKKVWLFVLLALIFFTHDKVRMGSKHSNFDRKTCACLWMNICMIILCFFSILLSNKLFVWKLLKLSLLSLSSYYHPIPCYVCLQMSFGQVLQRYYPSITHKTTNQVN